MAETVSNCTGAPDMCGLSKSTSLTISSLIGPSSLVCLRQSQGRTLQIIRFWRGTCQGMDRVAFVLRCKPASVASQIVGTWFPKQFQLRTYVFNRLILRGLHSLAAYHVAKWAREAKHLQTFQSVSATASCELTSHVSRPWSCNTI